MMNSSNTNLGGRIPASLQAVFLASNRGHEVNTPPPRKVAFKTFSYILNLKSKRQKYEKQGSKKAKVSTPVVVKSPQEFLDSALEARGYSTKCYTTTNSGYRNNPTPLQLASYDVHILKMVVLDKDQHALLDMLTCGISPNACNKFGESLLHRVCKFGKDKLLKVFLDCGADIQISDGAGRTPMHEVCRRPRPSFKTFELLLQQDARLLHMEDAAGAAPLSFVRVEQYSTWNEFLESILDTYWKPRDASAGPQGPPPLALEKSNSRQVTDPDNALPLELAALVSGGRMEPDEAIAAHNPAMDDEDSTWDDDYSSDSDDIDDTEFDETEFDETDFNFDEKEFEELQDLMNFGLSRQNKKEISLGRYFL